MASDATGSSSVIESEEPAAAFVAADVPVGDLLTDIDVQRDAATAGRYTLDVSPAWNIFYTFGGVTMAAALRAAEREIDRDDLEPLSAHAVFCSPVGAGPIEIDVDVVRNGRSAANVNADLRQAGHETTDLRLLATFGQRHESPYDYHGIEFPADVLPPELCPQRPDPAELSEVRTFPPVNFHQQNDWRPALEGFTWEENWGDREPNDARFASWFRLNREPRLADGTIDPVSYCVPADMLGPAIGRRMGRLGQEQPFLILSLDINLQFFATTTSEWTLQHVVSQRAANGYAYGTTELWDEQRQLIGLATQRARLRPFTVGEHLGPR
jgi:acyl-CoA thioesterase